MTIELEDGEIKSSKFVLAATSEYFSTMFKSNTFQESTSGIVKIPCKKIVMEKIIHHFYGKEFDPSELSVEEKLDTLNISRMMMVDEVYSRIDDDLYYIT